MNNPNSCASHSPGLDEGNPRKRQRTACDRCKTRKQRCDNEYPQCSNCAKSGATCSRPLQPEIQRSSYTRALEDQVAFLETRLITIERQQHHGRRDYDQELGTSHSSPSDYRLITGRGQQTSEVETPIPRTPKVQHNVADIVGILSLGSGNTEASSYVGTSSGYALATDLGRMVQTTAWNKALWVRAVTSDEEEARFTSGSSTRRITLQELQTNRAEPPSEVLGAKLIKAYLGRIHPRFPFLFRSDVWEAHRCRYTLGRPATRDIDETTPKYSSAAYEADGFALFVLYMVYAIGALNLRLTEDYRDTSPEQFYVFAMQHVVSVREASSIHNLEATVLLILYHLRSESRNGLWHLTGLAMRTVTDIGLHRAASTHGLPTFETQMRRRLFWSIYSLESILAGTLGRPVSLSDSDIDQPLPASVDDDDRLENVPPETLLTNEIPEQQALPPTTLSQFILLAQLHIFEARIQRKLYRVDKSIIALLPKMHRLMNDLESWRNNVLPTLQACEHDRVLLHYYRNVRLLLQPFLSILDPSSEPFRKAAVAAGQICQIHKRFHQAPEYGHSFVAVHTAFVSGITLLYVLWRGKERLWSIGISNDIRAASCVLSIMGERAPWIRRFRDTFDVLVEATMAALQGASEHAESDMGGGYPAAQSQADFSLFDHLDLADPGALDMARELTGWIT
ncbi:hypothetical protein P171DRAFT_495195 [Karstenula rhodostoma CBS 690.94]|uniref:Zn(2)-C6 fungal-type domain-containing protein n=1 Tax=Karstenula rhodostoma CBS 690.94 TaxID=1392251 RepID=A0A9P4UBL4_9PLEO|nr:hypothetical protein P171DRAFT_495195 [Karstenula rhodostoma CBS 690.94]